MKCVIIVQARMSSTRLPGKVLMELAGRPMLAQQLSRLKKSRLIDEIIVATTDSADDRALVELANKEAVRWFCGSEQDVLSRYVEAAVQSHADVIVRITADCPLIDPTITDKVISELIEHPEKYDYASNVLRRTYPRGLDAEAMFIDTLQRMDRMARSKSAREHVTVFLRAEHPDIFLCRSVEDIQDNSDLRWTVDTEEDLKLIRMIYNVLRLHERHVPYSEILAFVRNHPELTTLNSPGKTWDPICREIS
jgi:spore coat polysaccharide biosynthesis protein SpsF